MKKITLITNFLNRTETIKWRWLTNLRLWSESCAGIADSRAARWTERSLRQTGCPWRRAQTRRAPGAGRPASTHKPWWTGTGPSAVAGPAPGSTAPWARMCCWTALPCYVIQTLVPGFTWCRDLWDLQSSTAALTPSASTWGTSKLKAARNLHVDLQMTVYTLCSFSYMASGWFRFLWTRVIKVLKFPSVFFIFIKFFSHFFYLFQFSLS